MKMFLFCLLATLCICGCERYAPSDPNEKQKLINEVRQKAAKKIYKDLGLIPCGTGAQAMDQIKMLHLAFDYRKPVDIKTGRELLVAAVQIFAQEINANPEIRPYLDNYPFEPKNIRIWIFLKNPDGSNIEPEKLCVICATQGILEYENKNPETCRLTTIYKETYEEALQKIQESHTEITSGQNTQ